MFSALKKLFTQARAITYDVGRFNGFVIPRTKSGITITEETALNLSAVYCAVVVISQITASLDLILYRRIRGGKERAEDLALYRLLKDSPNPEQTSIVFKEALVSSLLRWGNAYVEIVRAGVKPKELWLIPPHSVTVDRNAGGGLIYRVMQADGKEKVLLPADVLHIPCHPDPTGAVGYSPIRLARESLGLTAALQDFGSAFFKNSAKMSGAIMYPGKLGDVAKENMRKGFMAAYSGTDNAGSVAVFEEGATFQPFTIPPEDAQFLATREFQTIEVCRWFNISPVWLHDLGRATWNNMEQLFSSLIQITLMPHLKKIEREVSKKLLTPLEQETLFAEHLVDGLLRGDTRSRYDVYEIGIRNKILLPNEARAMENRNPLPGGDTFEEPEPEPVDTPDEPDEPVGNEDDVPPDGEPG